MATSATLTAYQKLHWYSKKILSSSQRVECFLKKRPNTRDCIVNSCASLLTHMVFLGKITGVIYVYLLLNNMNLCLCIISCYYFAVSKVIIYFQHHLVSCIPAFQRRCQLSLDGQLGWLSHLGWPCCMGLYTPVIHSSVLRTCTWAHTQTHKHKHNVATLQDLGEEGFYLLALFTF